MAIRDSVEHWFRRGYYFKAPQPSDRELAEYLLHRMEKAYPERKDTSGSVVEPAGIPPSHAFTYRAMKLLAERIVTSGG